MSDDVEMRDPDAVESEVEDVPVDEVDETVDAGEDASGDENGAGDEDADVAEDEGGEDEGEEVDADNDVTEQNNLEGSPEAGDNDDEDANGNADEEGSGIPPAHPVPLQRKDKGLKELLNSMDEYAPIIPDAVTDFYLAKAGFETKDVRIKRLLALATQKFVSDIASDAYQYSRIRSASSIWSASNPQARARALMAGMTGGAAPSAAGSAGTAGPTSGSQGKLVLTMEDLGNALAEYGLNVKKPEFYR